MNASTASRTEVILYMCREGLTGTVTALTDSNIENYKQHAYTKPSEPRYLGPKASAQLKQTNSILGGVTNVNILHNTQQSTLPFRRQHYGEFHQYVSR